jgi:hypothetical protein
MSTTGRVINPPGTPWSDKESRLEEVMNPFLGRWDRCVYEKAGGQLVTARKRIHDWPRLWKRHLAGTQRLGAFPIRPNGLCRFGVIDLDAHDPSIPDRHPEAAILTDFVARLGIITYQETSRGGRGVHVWIFFEAPGVDAGHLAEFLEIFADELRTGGPVDVYPSSRSTKGGPILLPYFGGAVNVLDVDFKPIPRDKLDSNDPRVIPRNRSGSYPSWPPLTWCLPRAPRGGKAENFRAVLEEATRAGTVFWRNGQPQAHEGSRNGIAGAIARDILRRGGTFEDFEAWDANNDPPLTTDKPQDLMQWWEWALK